MAVVHRLPVVHQLLEVVLRDRRWRLRWHQWDPRWSNCLSRPGCFRTYSFVACARKKYRDVTRMYGRQILVCCCSCPIGCCARACWRREQLTSWTVQDWTEMVFCGRRTPNVKGPRRRRRRWNWRSFASSHGLRFNESTGNYGVPRVDRRGAALPRLGDSVCLFCFEPKSIYTYTRISVQPTSLVTALPRSYPDSWQHSD